MGYKNKNETCSCRSNNCQMVRNVKNENCVRTLNLLSKWGLEIDKGPSIISSQAVRRRFWCCDLSFIILYKVQVGKDQEKAQSERDSHPKNRGGKKPN